MTTIQRLPKPSAPHPEGSVYVDLDGTLIRSDLLFESVWLLARRSPLSLLRLPFWLLSGRAHLKARLADRVTPDPRTLPYREDVLAYVTEQRKLGRRAVLASASEQRWVHAVADHLGIFDGVLATHSTDGVRTNLAGVAKLDAIRAECAHDGDRFEYLGNSSSDLPIWAEAQRVTLVAPSIRAERMLKQAGRPYRLLVPRPQISASALRALRVYQWVKNALFFVPLLLAHQFLDLGRLLDVIVAFGTFCVVASASYIFNDLLDIEADRQHPTKRKRPFASGSLPIPVGVVMMGGLFLVGFAASMVLLPGACTLMLAAYLTLTLSYSMYFKQKLFLDVLLLAGLYTHRVLAGGIAADVRVSPWLVAFSTFFFLSLALVKRYVELMRARSSEQHTLGRRAYHVGDINLVETMGLSSGYISVLVLCLFLSSDDVSKLYRSAELLWLMCPVMLYWISRVWLLAHRGELHDDPVIFASRDRTSYLCGILIAGIVAAGAL